MKPILLLVGLLLTVSLHGQTTNRLALAWDSSPSYGTNTDFHVYSSMDVNQPIAQWQHWTNVTFSVATNAAKAGEGGRIEILSAEDQQRFYAVAPSNFTGRAAFSSPVSVRRLPTGTGLRIGAW